MFSPSCTLQLNITCLYLHNLLLPSSPEKTTKWCFFTKVWYIKWLLAEIVWGSLPLHWNLMRALQTGNFSGFNLFTGSQGSDSREDKMQSKSSSGHCHFLRNVKKDVLSCRSLVGNLQCRKGKVFSERTGPSKTRQSWNFSWERADFWEKKPQFSE